MENTLGIISKRNGHPCKMQKIFKGQSLYCQEFPHGKILSDFLKSDFIKLSKNLKIYNKWFFHKPFWKIHFNSFMTEAVIIQKPLVCGANQWTCFYIITASVMKELKLQEFNLPILCYFQRILQIISKESIET